jgi:predicted neuraminidase
MPLKKQFAVLDHPLIQECHASTLLRLPNGDLLVAFFGGSKEGAGDVAIWLSRCHDDEWAEPVKVADESGLPHWNPILFHDDGLRVLLFYKVGQRISEWSTRVIVSYDGGLSWSEPSELVRDDRGGRGPVKNKMLVASNGAWLAPASKEGHEWDAFVDVSEDGGSSWHPSELVPVDHKTFVGAGIIQPTLWESSPGHIHMLLRSTCGWVCRSDSTDYGKSWTPVQPTALPNNNSGLDVARVDDGRLVLVYNPVGTCWGPRTPLVAVVSDDNGMNWRPWISLESDLAPPAAAGVIPSDLGVSSAGVPEYSYPAIIATPGSRVAISYTWRRRGIAVVHAECRP